MIKSLNLNYFMKIKLKVARVSQTYCHLTDKNVKKIILELFPYN